MALEGLFFFVLLPSFLRGRECKHKLIFLLLILCIDWIGQVKKKKNLKKGKEVFVRKKATAKSLLSFISFELVGRIEVTKLILFFS